MVRAKSFSLYFSASYCSIVPALSNKKLDNTANMDHTVEMDHTVKMDHTVDMDHTA